MLQPYGWQRTIPAKPSNQRQAYRDGELADDDIYLNLVELVSGHKPGRENADKRTCFNAVGLAYVDVAIASATFDRASEAGMGQDLKIQHEMIFEHAHLKDWVRI